jgi:tetratricopeptide (TPR) repeat protein
MGEKKLNEAIEIFKFNIELYPNSWNVYDSMGEAYLNNGDTELAIQNYKKSLELNPNNEGGKEMLKKLEK